MVSDRPQEHTREPASAIGRSVEKDVATVEALKQRAGGDAPVIAIPADSRAFLWHRANALRHKLDNSLVMDDFSHVQQAAMLATLSFAGAR